MLYCNHNTYNTFGSNIIRTLLFVSIVFMFEPLYYFSHYTPSLQNPFGYKLPLAFITISFSFALSQLINRKHTLEYKLESIDKVFLFSIMTTIVFESLLFFKGKTPHYEIAYRFAYIYLVLLFSNYSINTLNLNKVFVVKIISFIGTLFATTCIGLYIFAPELQYPVFKVFKEPPLGAINTISYISAFIAGAVLLSPVKNFKTSSKILLITPHLILIQVNQSRGAILAFTLPILLIGLIRLRTKTKLIIATSVTTACAIGHKTIFNMLNSFYGGNLISLFTQSASETLTGDFISSSRRVTIAINTLSSFFDKFPLGSGLGDIETTHFILFDVIEKNIAHTFPLILLASYGIGGIFIVYLFFEFLVKSSINTRDPVIIFILTNFHIMLIFEAFIPLWSSLVFLLTFSHLKER